MERAARERLEQRLESLGRELDAYRCPVHGEAVSLEDGRLRACCDQAEKDAVALVEGRAPGAAPD